MFGAGFIQFLLVVTFFSVPLSASMYVWRYLSGTTTTHSHSVIYSEVRDYHELNIPGKRESPASARSNLLNKTFVLSGGKGYVYGGGDYINYLNDLWEFNLDLEMWRCVFPYNHDGYSMIISPDDFHSINQPGGRELSRMFHIPQNGSLIGLIGGLGKTQRLLTILSGLLDDIWLYDIEEMTWKNEVSRSMNEINEIPVYASSDHDFHPSNSMGGRSEVIVMPSPSSFNRQSILIFGGRFYFSFSGLSNHVFEYDFTTREFAFHHGDKYTSNPSMIEGTLLEYDNVTNPGYLSKDSMGYRTSGSEERIIILDRSDTSHVLLVWELNTTLWQWRLRRDESSPVLFWESHKHNEYTASAYPLARFGAIHTQISDTELFLFGGRSHLISTVYDGPVAFVYNAELNQFKWVYHAPLGAWRGNYGAKGEYSSSNWMGERGEGGIAYFQETNEVFLFSGDGFDNTKTISFDIQNDLFSFSLDTFSWKWISGENRKREGNFEVKGSFGSEVRPGERNQAGGFSVNSDGAYIFGGRGFDVNGYEGFLGDLWEFQISSQTWRFVTGWEICDTNAMFDEQYKNSPFTFPGGRWLANFAKIRATDDSDDEKVILFGGYGKDKDSSQAWYLGDFYHYDFTTERFSWIGGMQKGSAGTWGILGEYDENDIIWPRIHSFFHGLRKDNEMIVIGGRESAFSGFNDVHVCKFDIFKPEFICKWIKGSQLDDQLSISIVDGEYHPNNTIGGGHSFIGWTVNHEIDKNVTLVYTFGGVMTNFVGTLRTVNYVFCLRYNPNDLSDTMWRFVSGDPDNGDYWPEGYGEFSPLNQPHSGALPSFAYFHDEIVFVYGVDQAISNQFTQFNSTLEQWKIISGEYNPIDKRPNYSLGISGNPGARGVSIGIGLVNKFVIFGGAAMFDIETDKTNDIWVYTHAYQCDHILEFDFDRICNGHGVCISDDNCTCQERWNNDQFCAIPDKCDGIAFYADPEIVCNGHGVCISNGICNCTERWQTDEFCGVPDECDGIPYYELAEVVCHGHGVCSAPNTCVCQERWNNDEFCDVPDKCFGISFLEFGFVCSGVGNCTGVGMNNSKCECPDRYKSKEDCTEADKCYGIDFNDYDRVCSSHGVCEKSGECTCFENFFGAKCDIVKCFEFFSNESSVCRSRGNCLSPNNCTCHKNYFSDECEETWCHGFESNNIKQVCSGKGECYDFDRCRCDAVSSGENCENWSLWMTGLTASGGSIVFVLVSIVCVLMMICVGYFMSRRLKTILEKWKKFKKLENIDILLEEQEIEYDESIKNIKIDKQIFEIPYSDIKLMKVLGSGAQGVVYLAEWKSKDVVFKKFALSGIGGSSPGAGFDQDMMEEFEKELNILINLHAPNIAQCFGASCELSRNVVGIVMEFCEHGNLLNYLLKHKNDDGTSITFKRKLKFYMDVLCGVDYLHSMKIIYRDCKLENIGVTKSLDCKLLDFGLSRTIAKDENMTRGVGTSFYRAPELVLGSQYDESVDYFSLSVFCYVLFTENFAPYGEDSGGSYEIRAAKDPNFRPNLDAISNDHSWLKKIIELCWDANPKVRLSCKQVLERVGGKFKDLEDEESSLLDLLTDEMLKKLMKVKKSDDLRKEIVQLYERIK